MNVAVSTNVWTQPEGYFIHHSGRWFGPVENPLEIADGWLRYGQTGQGRAKSENWKIAPLKPAPRLASEKRPSKSRLTLYPELLKQGSPRCLCPRCGEYFTNERAFSLHQKRVGVCAVGDRQLRNAGLRISKTHHIRGHEVLEWGV